MKPDETEGFAKVFAGGAVAKVDEGVFELGGVVVFWEVGD